MQRSSFRKAPNFVASSPKSRLPARAWWLLGARKSDFSQASSNVVGRARRGGLLNYCTTAARDGEREKERNVRNLAWASVETAPLLLKTRTSSVHRRRQVVRIERCGVVGNGWGQTFSSLLSPTHLVVAYRSHLGALGHHQPTGQVHNGRNPFQPTSNFQSRMVRNGTSSWWCRQCRRQ